LGGDRIDGKKLEGRFAALLGFAAPGTGRHLIIDGKSSSPVLADPAKLAQHVNELVGAIGMTALQTVAVQIPLELAAMAVQPAADEGGVSVVAILSTSHIALHSWPECSAFTLDVFSCRDFAPERVTAWATEALAMRAFTSETWRR
jgi:S-adenosylmethionine/arginine decarboxylase-like enzyme